MGFFDDEYTYGENDDVDKRLRKIMRVNPNYLEYFKLQHGRYPRRAEIEQEYSRRSVRGQFYLLADGREETDIWLEKRERRYRQEREDSGDIGFWGSIGGLIGAIGGLMFEIVDEDEEDY